MKLNIEQDLEGSYIYRCDVKVTNTEESEATDSTLIHAEAVDLYLIYEGKYTMVNQNPWYDVANEIKVGVTGDNDKPFVGELTITYTLNNGQASGTEVEKLTLAVPDQSREFNEYRVTKISDSKELIKNDVNKTIYTYKNCGAGKHFDTNSKSCKPCESGYRSSDMSQFNGCKKCPDLGCPSDDKASCDKLTVHQVSLDGFSCIECPNGTQPDNHNKTCILCEAGTAGKGCKKCEPPEYAPEKGLPQCLLCNGVVNDNQCGQCKPGKGKKDDSCEDCDEGEESPYGLCIACKPGTYSGATGSISCTKCPRGKHQDEERQTQCKTCLPNTFSSIEGAAKCTDVEKGHKVVVVDDAFIGQEPCKEGEKQALNDTGAHICKKCEVKEGMYQPAKAQTECKKVSDGFKVSLKGTTQEVCLKGTSSGGKDDENDDRTRCVSCTAKDGYYSKHKQAKQCSKVNNGFYIIPDSNGNGIDVRGCSRGTSGDDNRPNKTVCTKCEPGYYQDKESMEKCVPLPKGSIAVNDSSDNTLYIGAMKCSDGMETANAFECKKCAAGYFKNKDKVECQPIQSGYISQDGITISKCGLGTFELKGSCSPCDFTKGEYQNKPGMAECSRIKNGEGFVYEEDESKLEPMTNKSSGKVIVKQCLKGEYSTGAVGKRPFRCQKCDVDNGEYQDNEQMPYCKIAVPGYRLSDDEPSKNPIIECQPGTYSKGSSKVCRRCDPVKKQYQNMKASAYCKICNLGQITVDINGNGVDCVGLRCEEASETKDQIRDKAFVFTSTAAGEYLSIPCQEQNTSSKDVSSHEERVVRLCKYDHKKNVAFWKPADYSLCRTKKTKEFEELQREVSTLTTSKENMSPIQIASSLGTLSARLKGVTGDGSRKRTGNGTASAGKSDMTARDVTDAITTLSEFSTVLGGINATDEIVAKAKSSMEKSMIYSIADVGATDSDSLRTVNVDAKAKMLGVVEKLADDMTETIETSVLSVQRLDISGARKRIASKRSGSTPPTSTNIPLPKPTGMDKLEQPSLELDPNDVNSGSVAVFNKNSKHMFPDPGGPDAEPSATGVTEDSDEPVSRTELESCVVSLNLKPGTGKSLDFKLRMKVDTSNDTELQKKKRVSRSCSFLNTTTKRWSDVGCVTVGPDADGYMECKCNHTTSFAILLSISDIDDKTQDIVSEYFFYVNATFLLLTFICTVSFTQRRLMILQSQLALALFLGNVGFHLLSKLIKVNVDELDKPLYSLNMGCYVGVIVVQYLFLVAISWMTACSYTLHSKIVDAIKTFGKNDPFYMVKCFVSCWGLPLLLPTSGFLVSYYINDFTKDSMIDWPMTYIPMKQNASCWVQSPWKWVTFMIPCYLCLLVNCGVFLMITRVMIRASKRGSSGQGYGRQAKALVTMSITVGVPWIVGMLTFEPIKDVGQWLFIILTGLQGPVMFIMMVVLQGEVISALLRPFGVQPPEWLSQSTKVSLQKQSSSHHTVTESILARDKPYDPKGIDPETAVALEEEKKKEAEETNVSLDDNVYTNQVADDDKTLLEPTTDNKNRTSSSDDHTYYECTHFPSNTDTTSISSQLPPPVIE